MQHFKLTFFFFFQIYWFVIVNVSYRSVGKVFCTMDGRGSMILIHPSSAVNMFLDNRIFISIGKKWSLQYCFYLLGLRLFLVFFFQGF